MYWLIVLVFTSVTLQTCMIAADLETSSTYLSLHLLDEVTNKKMEIKYLLLNHSVARKFEFLVHRHLNNPHEIQSLAWAVFAKGRDALIRTHNELKAHMDFIDNFQYKGRNLFQFKHKLPPLGQYTLELYPCIYNYAYRQLLIIS